MSGTEDKNLTPLLPLIESYFQASINRSELNQFLSTKELVVGIIEKGAVMCITDMRHSMQAVKSKASLDKVHPFSRQGSQYYSVADRSWISFNAKLQDLREPSQYPHPYQPCFYFKTHYEDYRRERRELRLRLECELVRVKRWSLRVVNVSESGYYGVVMELLEFRYTGEKSIQEVGEVTSLLYQPGVKAKLQAVRLEDLRRMYSRNENPKSPWSMFYSCRNVDFNPHAKRKASNILVVDKQGEILEYDGERRQRFVNFGMMEGAYCLQFPLDSQEIDQGRMRKINVERMEVLYNRITEPRYVEAREERRGELWSSDESQSLEEQGDSGEVDSRSDSEQDEDDPLRNLYLKQFQNLRIL